MEATFELMSSPRMVDLPAFRFAHHRVRGAYTPWTRVQALDAVAEALEMANVERIGPAFGIYHDLPFSDDEPDKWRADLGHPVPMGVPLPRRPGLRETEVPPVAATGLRYRGDLASFPQALDLLLAWMQQRDIAFEGPLLERFHVSDALSGVEERDVFVALHRIGR